jgi:hypothetical protein
MHYMSSDGAIKPMAIMLRAVPGSCFAIAKRVGNNVVRHRFPQRAGACGAWHDAKEHACRARPRPPRRTKRRCHRFRLSCWRSLSLGRSQRRGPGIPSSARKGCVTKRRALVGRSGSELAETDTWTAPVGWSRQRIWQTVGYTNQLMGLNETNARHLFAHARLAMKDQEGFSHTS